jgi:hypothetical protein
VAQHKFSSGLEHFIKRGQFENRRSSAFFDISTYIANNADVVTAVANHAAGLATSLVEHFLIYGQKEGREANDLFSEQYYLTTNSDVAAAVTRKLFASGFEQFAYAGAREERNPSTGFDTAYYIANNPDVATLVANGTMTAFEHYVLIGRAENRAPHA